MGYRRYTQSTLTSGTWSGYRLTTPRRPKTEKARESIFTWMTTNLPGSGTGQMTTSICCLSLELSAHRFNSSAEKIFGLEGSRLNGERVSNTTARQYREVMQGSYADLNTGRVHVNRGWGTRSNYADEVESVLSNYLKKKR